MVFFLGKLHFLINFKDRVRIALAVRNAVGGRLPGKELSTVVSQVFNGILSHYYEKLYIAFEEVPKATRFLKQAVSPEGLEVLREKLARGRGVMMVTGHYGAIEYIPTFLAVHGFPVTMIARFKTPQLKEKVFRQAEIYGVRILDADCEGNVLKTAVNELKENRILITECDEMEEWRPSPKRSISFLGRVTGLDRTINVLHKRTGAEVVFAVIHRHSLHSYSFIARPVNLEEGGISKNSCVGSELLKILEGYIFRYPEQWYQWKNYFLIGGQRPGEEALAAGGLGLPFHVPNLRPFLDKAFAPLLQRGEV